MNNIAIVNKVIPFSCVDGPGSRLVIFLQGCNYRCKSCHNPYTIDLCDSCGHCLPTCPTQALSLITSNNKPQVIWNEALCSQCDACLTVCPRQSTPKTQQNDIEQLLALISHHAIFINGITLSGGEASLQLPFIVTLFRAIKATPALAHLSCMLDSNGSLNYRGWQQLIPYMDGAMIDLKSWQQDTHRFITGRDNHRVISSVNLLAEHGKLHEVRLLHIPGVSDFDSEITAVASYLKTLPIGVRVKLNAFQQHGVTGSALSWPACTREQISQLATDLEQLGVTNIVLPSSNL